MNENGRTQSVMVRMAERFGMDHQKFERTLMATVIPGGKASPEQVAAVLLVADQHGLNPFTKEIYAFPSRGGGVVPVVGVDGWARILNDHPQFDGMDFQDHETVLEDGTRRLDAVTCRIYRKDRSHPVSVTEYMSECARNTDPWKTHPRRMLRHKALIQCGRLAFSFSGIYDEDEAQRIVQADSRVRVIERSASDMDELKAKLLAERNEAPAVENAEDELAGSVENPELFGEA